MSLRELRRIAPQNCAAEIAPNCARRGAPPLDRLQRDDDDRPVEQALAQRAGALDLDGDRAAVVRLALVHLAERRRGDARGAQRLEEGGAVWVVAVEERQPRRDGAGGVEVLGDDAEGLLVGERRVRRLQRLERLADVVGQDVGPLRERLPQLDGDGAERRQLGAQHRAAVGVAARLPRGLDAAEGVEEVERARHHLLRPRPEVVEHGVAVVRRHAVRQADHRLEQELRVARQRLEAALDAAEERARLGRVGRPRRVDLLRCLQERGTAREARDARRRQKPRLGTLGLRAQMSRDQPP